MKNGRNDNFNTEKKIQNKKKKIVNKPNKEEATTNTDSLRTDAAVGHLSDPPFLRNILAENKKAAQKRLKELGLRRSLSLGLKQEKEDSDDSNLEQNNINNGTFTIDNKEDSVYVKPKMNKEITPSNFYSEYFTKKDKNGDPAFSYTITVEEENKPEEVDLCLFEPIGSDKTDDKNEENVKVDFLREDSMSLVQIVSSVEDIEFGSLNPVLPDLGTNKFSFGTLDDGVRIDDKQFYTFKEESKVEANFNLEKNK